LEELDEGRLPVSDAGIVLDVDVPHVPPHRLRRLPLIEHEVVEGDRGLLVTLELVAHRSPPFSSGRAAAPDASTRRPRVVSRRSWSVSSRSTPRTPALTCTCSSSAARASTSTSNAPVRTASAEIPPTFRPVRASASR